MEANLALGFAADARDYGTAAQILRMLGLAAVTLLSNNPEKVAALERYGVAVTERRPLVIPPNSFNLRYLATKSEKFGHALSQ